MGINAGRPGVRRRRPISRGPCKASRQFQDAARPSPEETASFFLRARVIRLCFRGRDDESTII